MMLPNSRISALAPALCACVLFVLPGTGQAASADPAALEDYLQNRYYEVEFFVFERPDVLDFATEEILALDRPRALPNGIRTQRLAAEALWTTPLNPLTRGCLTFPTITYELLPEALETEVLAEEGTLSPDVPVDELPEQPAVPLPLIEPRLEPDPQLDFLAEVAAFERELKERSQRWLPSEEFLLQRAANRVERRGLGRILFHGRWLQAVPPRESPDPLLVTGGLPLSASPSDHELVGSVGVTLGRYLHFKADLFFHGPGLGLAPAEAVMRETGESLLLPAAEPPAEAVYMQLSESRRMRSEELHYLDHPKLGLVVRIDPVKVPDALLEALGALQTIEESAD